jgi:uncharacterized membrane protein
MSVSVIKAYLPTLVVFLLIDMLWLVVIARTFYREQIGFLMRSNVNWIPAILFYLLFVAGLLIFAVAPAFEGQSLPRAAVLGGLFGLFCYSTYDLTNYATLKDWPLTIVVVDIVWGMALSAIVASAGYLIAGWLP